MLRERLNESLKEAMKAKDSRRVSTLRLILAALKDRDIAARGKGETDEIGDEQILQMLATMVRQRRDSIAQYEQGGRVDLAEQEQEEIAIIEDFMPRQLSEDEVRQAAEALVAELSATGVKDMGRVMGEIKKRYTGQLDMGKASAVVKELLS
jgi:uncharacterized protein YqeY